MSDAPTGHISQRKLDHIDLCAQQQVEYRGKSTLLEEVEFLHDSLPELSLDAIDLSSEVMGKRLAAPLLITGMTGGAERAQEINLTLARVAQELGIAFGVGSQRAMMRHPDLAQTYRVREVAPDVLLFGNIGAVQVAESSTAELEDLVGAIDADALCVHLNPGQEMIQPEGDRDFRGCIDGIARLVDALSVPVIAKETGCGIGPRALDKLKQTGVQWVDTSGAGGTTWVGVETLRTTPEKAEIGDMFWDWGVPTGAAIGYAAERGFQVIGSGGLRTGLDAARAIALGANLAGMALPWLKAAYNEGPEAALKYGHTTLHALRVACLLTGSHNLAELRQAPRILGPNLQRWLAHQ
ncbi:type 2 isopentenyl-diphosphate Delta-isomerase [Bradymonas sediminis]|uniref:Isopentenyl-diphosphate delta-isomerase n=1 Tax=Bradymonas sediminis TaxID=1548548 RepID=A0A2Z4FN12_9DELT|nr:type 2 isopentenyl-diphosphate Delta-isomerase [Bradymonas sediminis]AWV90323.1 type 2 isopentenyl-diphosphate Delta-isomerase [Bradymonas sediminis]TDP75701.1 isopentenyl-diphosphate delta-isomerase [Bradymonas sediminis]